MNLITKRPEGAPDWIPPAVLCRVRDDEYKPWETDYIYGYEKLSDADMLVFIGISSNWAIAEPIEAWQPQKDEIVAAWDDGSNYFNIREYLRTDDSGHLVFRSSCSDGELSWKHCARLVYPDGRVIDCTCSVEELKKRVGEGNWL